MVDFVDLSNSVDMNIYDLQSTMLLWTSEKFDVLMLMIIG